MGKDFTLAVGRWGRAAYLFLRMFTGTQIVSRKPDSENLLLPLLALVN